MVIVEIVDVLVIALVNDVVSVVVIGVLVLWLNCESPKVMSIVFLKLTLWSSHARL